MGQGPRAAQSLWNIYLRQGEGSDRKELQQGTVSNIEDQSTITVNSAGTPNIPSHRFKANFVGFYEEFVEKNKSETNRSLPCSLEKFKEFLFRKVKNLSPDVYPFWEQGFHSSIDFYGISAIKGG
ncbi:hypothetical protein [Chitinophaga qingshengii]|uniref:Beta-ketoacyl synthase N-terminal domain-containing protein n=1 Tax=Chitinophaga qingshengii TaxID=1569794 RepID=A0ABR7TIF5_9BACT|nr:hypothetical protein [Chitinophaga qingshengii]MBC9929291.1 hypothetical protein [Chitinophaga qingshengii]